MVHVLNSTFGKGITFYEGPTNQGSNGCWGACGPYGLGVALAAAKGIPFTGAWLDTIISRMESAGKMNCSSGCTPAGLIWYIQTYHPELKFSIAGGIDFSGSAASTAAFHAAVIPALIAGKVACAEWLNAQALLNNEQNVHVHYTSLGGIDSALGYFMMNGDKVPDNIPNSAYWLGWGYMSAALPCFLMLIDPAGANGMTVPAGWTDDGTTLKASNGVPVVRGMRDFILADPTWDATDVAVAAEFSRDPVTLAGSDGAGVVQYFYKSILAYTTAKNVFRVIDPGKEAYVGATRVLPPPPPIDLSAQVSQLNTATTIVQNVVKNLQNTPGVKA